MVQELNYHPLSELYYVLVILDPFFFEHPVAMVILAVKSSG